jgi:2-methylisocitrate lyase-like PEP mutase family enzyme
MQERQGFRGQRFLDLHASSSSFVLPNAWCGGSARLLQTLGFQALGTTSAGAAFARGRPDRSLGLRQMLENIAEICSATSLPVTADLQDGFAVPPEQLGKIIQRAAECGAVSCSIEDARSDAPGAIYSVSEAADRVRAAVEAAASLPFPFLITARADNFFEGVQDLDDTLHRLQVYESCGADVLYAPGLTTLHQVEEVLSAVQKPLNVLLHGAAEFDVATLAAIGVRRVSVGGYLARVALDAMVHAASELQSSGVASKVGLSSAHLNDLFGREPQAPER